MSSRAQLEILDFALRRITHDVRTPLGVAICALSDLRVGPNICEAALADGQSALGKLRSLLDLLGSLTAPRPAAAEADNLLRQTCRQLDPSGAQIIFTQSFIHSPQFAACGRLLVLYLWQLRDRYQLATPVVVNCLPQRVEIGLAGLPPAVLRHLGEDAAGSFLASRDNSAAALCLLAAELFCREDKVSIERAIDENRLQFVLTTAAGNACGN